MKYFTPIGLGEKTRALAGRFRMFAATRPLLLRAVEKGPTYSHILNTYMFLNIHILRTFDAGILDRQACQSPRWFR